MRLVISVLKDATYKTDSEIYEGLQNQFPAGFIEIAPLTAKDGRDILIALEGQVCRLRDGQRDYIIRQFETSSYSPLWLRTAFEIAKSWKSVDQPGEDRHVLATDTTGLIAQFIDELTGIHHHERQLVTRVLGYLAASKNGLSAKELTEVLSDDATVMGAISSHVYGVRDTGMLPPSIWVRLSRQLSPFFIEKRFDEQPLL